MGIWDAFTDIVEAVTPWSVVEAEAPAEESKEEQPESESKEAEADDDEEEEDEDEDEDDEEELVDPKETLEEECKNSPQCSPAKHHFDECVERVQQQEENEGGAKEDCVEEFFHLAHCATACAAPKLWSKLRFLPQCLALSLIFFAADLTHDEVLVDAHMSHYLLAFSDPISDADWDLTYPVGIQSLRDEVLEGSDHFQWIKSRIADVLTVSTVSDMVQRPDVHQYAQAPSRRRYQIEVVGFASVYTNSDREHGQRDNSLAIM
ncbi:hypothetical protein FZEAL_10648 [Fusarium zealandicum]|uniref:Cytochrome b-c1 complex subunit 6, mitochondrial n=1 Tax=Fusarium zealandicum TaxID=1053134 RepID=A0A8H4XA00_9HYPO|nr:hypothetical protein FZEAL_10648 [Fusarium zealandicum]